MLVDYHSPLLLSHSAYLDHNFIRRISFDDLLR
jgi:hypothetical protein